MNGFTEHGLSEGDFGSNKGGIASFDAFPKTKATYLTRTRNGGIWTVVMMVTCAYLVLSETIRWFSGTTTHVFSVEKGISHELQINLDIVVAMQCPDIHINVQDAAGDRILAGEALKRDPTLWKQWGKGRNVHKLGMGKDDKPHWEEEEDVHDYLSAARGKKKFKKTPRFRGPGDSCRIYGSLELNKVQADFHITARGHGYLEIGEHLPHNRFNFSHQINELSFGPFYPSLTNPLDNTYSTTDLNFYKYQYYLSVVPTIYTEDAETLALMNNLNPNAPPPPADIFPSLRTIWTNQYAVTEQSHTVPETHVPGVFVKFDIEPITLTIAEEWGGLLALIVRLVNVVSGVMVAGQWCSQIWDWANETLGQRRKRRGTDLGVLTGRRSGEYNEKLAYD